MKIRALKFATVGLLVTVSWACDRTPAARAAIVVDSIIPRDEALRRFRVGVDSVSTLTGGRPSRDALMRDFLRAVEARDTATLRAMQLTRAEFAWIFYPTNPQGLPPYDLSPSLMRFMMEGRSAHGLSQLLEARGGRPMHVAGYSCDTTTVEGANRVHQLCTIRRVQAPGDTVTERIFGPILERDGAFKFVSYTNRL